MPEARKCQQCGTTLSSDAPEGLCPACALEGALKLGNPSNLAAEGKSSLPRASEAHSEAVGDSIQASGLTPQAEGVEFCFLAPCDVPGRIGRLGQYEIMNVVGRGGMGIVFRAFDPKLQRVVAIKAMAPELVSNAVAVKRFLREARAVAALSHERVITIFGVEDGFEVPFLVMEYVEGQSLQAKLKKVGALSTEEIVRVGMQIAEGLSAAHRQGLIHRDIKPANILLENGVERVKITDFGLACAVDDAGFTKTSQIVGSPNFMAPEQAQGRSIDHRADLFALGSVLYALCTGQSPFRAESVVAILHLVCHDTPRPISEVNPDIPQWLARIVERLMAKRPEQRFQTAEEVAFLLRQGLVSLQPGPRFSPGQRTSVLGKPGSGLLTRMLTFGRSRMGLAGALALLLLGGGIIVLKALRSAPSVPISPFSATQARLYQDAWAAYSGVPAIATNSIGMVLRLIPPGEFYMGSREEDAKLLEAGDWFFAGWAAERIRYEFPRHKVRITQPFALCVNEVTVGQFRAFIARTGYKTVAERSEQGGFGWTAEGWQRRNDFNWTNPGYTQSDNRPVGNVAWADANEFCRWLSREEDRHYRLPTEAEWEFACRAGAQGWFHNGDRDEGLKLVANIADQALKGQHAEFIWARAWNDQFPFAAPVGQFAPNAFGLFDMHGNVWEWCLDFYDPGYYRHSPEVDPICQRASSYHVFRGGGWDNYPGFCRSADRYSSHSQTLRTDWAGFRVVRELNTTSSRTQARAQNPPVDHPDSRQERLPAAD